VIRNPSEEPATLAVASHVSLTPTPTARPYPPARVMFWIAFLHVLLVADVAHRAGQAEATHVEVWVIAVGLFILWPLITVETWLAVLFRDRAIRPLRPTLIRAIAITLVPPLRMGMPDPWTGRLWLPTWGWCERGKALEDRLDRTFHKPMLIFAVLILPVLGLEFLRAEAVRSTPVLALLLHASVAIIWVAFATEFAIKVSAGRHPLVYCKERWIDLAIVVLPLLEFARSALADLAPVARLLRLTRAVAHEQLARMGQMYRVRGLIAKGWRAVLVLRVVARLTGNTPEKQLRKLEGQIAEADSLLADLRNQAEELRRQRDSSEAVRAP
jgi:hypothetical protein